MGLFQLHKDDRLYTEAYEKLLDSWTTFFSDSDYCCTNMLRNEAIQMIHSFIKCHMGPPDGVRSQVRSQPRSQSERSSRWFIFLSIVHIDHSNPGHSRNIQFEKLKKYFHFLIFRSPSPEYRIFLWVIFARHSHVT